MIRLHLKSFIIIGVLIGSLLSFTAAYLITSAIYENTIRLRSQDFVDLISHQIDLSITELMRKGWKRADIEEFLKVSTIDEREIINRIEIFRSKTVEAKFGKGRDIPDEQVLKVVSTRKDLTVHDKYEIVHIYAVIARAECLDCHTNANINETMGAIRISANIKPILVAAKKRLSIYFILLSPIPVVIAFAIAALKQRKLDNATRTLHRKVSELHRISDLKTLHLETVDLGFEELNEIMAEFGRFTEHMRGLSVDRDLMEFQVRNLERFTLISEVLRDLRTNISGLLKESNTISGIPAIFYAFRIDDDPYEAEVYWLREPSEELSQRMKGAVLRAIASMESEEAASKAAIENIIVTPGTLDNTAAGFEIETRELHIGSPDIAGIAGVMIGSTGAGGTALEVVKSTVLTTMLNVIASAKAIFKYMRSSEYYATRDPLTGLYNQRMFREFLRYEVERARRKGYVFCAIMLDIDDFKSINDRYGHSVSDALLAEVAVRMRPAIRSSDILTRYGGDEFAIILPQTPKSEGYSVAERIMDELGKWSFEAPDGVSMHVTVSMGVAAFPDHATDTKSMLRATDDMMHEAKIKGKNRICHPPDIGADENIA